MSKKTEAQFEFAKIDRLIRQGELANARNLIKSLLPRRLPRPALARYASLCRRVHLVDFAIAALNPLIRGKAARAHPPEPAEVAEYAASLTLIGAVREAMDLLADINEREYPRALLFRAYALFQTWDYRASLPFLRLYVRTDLEPYDRLIALVNLAAAEIATGLTKEAAVTLAEAKRDCKAMSATRLLGNCYELEAQLGVALQDFDRSRKALVAAREFLGGQSTFDSISARKWEAIVEYHAGKSRQATLRLKAVREEALSQKYWEGVRDCDFHLAISSGDGQLLQRLYHGTPWKEFRAKLLDGAPRGWKPDPDFIRWFGGKSGPVLDLTSKSPDDSGLGQPLLIHLTEILASDLYAPFRAATLFSLLYEEEYFNPQTSPSRVKQLVYRLSKTLKGLRYPLRIVSESHAYAFFASGSCGLKIDFEILSRSRLPSEGLMAKLSLAFDGATFRAAEAARVLSVPRRTANRLLEEGVQRGRIDRLGRGNATVYRMNP